MNKIVSMNDIYILGIESSCDDTSAAVLRNGVLLSNVTASQEVHKAYGGVVPELASRAHQQNVVPVVDQAIKRAGMFAVGIGSVDQLGQADVIYTSTKELSLEELKKKFGR